ncbi:uncharacterized protein LOC135155127 isoform X2 [Lytechinus pictus]|uniref:uncharacterized protein LOC135155127 isoform X2 n=1 Tax=Lytechinus pictus TaxID=7653 RepID=UPI0030B9C5BD
MAVPKRKLVLRILYVLNVCSFVFFTGIQGDVPDDVVYTELHKDVRIGDSAVLTCRFRGSPLAVYWKKGDDPRNAPNLVSWIPSDDVFGKCERQRPCEVMEMNENRSLVIKEISMEEQGRYICRVANYKGYLIHNFTDVRIFLVPLTVLFVIGALGAFIWWKRTNRDTSNGTKKGSSMCGTLTVGEIPESVPMIKEPTIGGKLINEISDIEEIPHSNRDEYDPFKVLHEREN